MVSDALNEMLQSTFRAEKTSLSIKANVQLFIDWRGDVPIRSITRADLIDFRDHCLRKLPVNVSKKRTYDGMTVKEILKTYDGDDIISNRTVNNDLHRPIDELLPRKPVY